jgi:hypothetical protein
MNKQCKSCNLVLDISSFSKNNKYFRNVCKQCSNKKNKKYYGKYVNKHKEYIYKNKDKIKDYCRNYFVKNKKSILEKSKIYYANNKDKVLKRTKNYRENNKDWYRNYKKNYRNNNKIVSNIRRGIWGCVKNNKTEKSLEYVGCSLEELLHHLKSQFKDGMTFENYGEWHIDHIKPLSSFDFNGNKEYIENQLKLAWHFSNLQPLWAKENLTKGKSQA